jgi:ketosteroid isomerase-like protein
MEAHTPEDCDRLFAEHVNAGDREALLALYESDCASVKSSGAGRALEVVRRQADGRWKFAIDDPFARG